MGGISKELLSSALQNAQRLCSPNSKAQTGKAVSSQQLDEGFDDQARAYEKALGFGMDDDYEDAQPQAQYRRAGDINYNQISAAKSSIPENIKKSMLEHKIEVKNPETSSVLDSLGVKAVKKQNITPAQMLGEEARPQVIQAPSSVDYSIIKAIVNECLNEYFSRRQPLNEVATLDTIGIKNGVITLIDNKGQAFAAKLQKIEKND